MLQRVACSHNVLFFGNRFNIDVTQKDVPLFKLDCSFTCGGTCGCMCHFLNTLLENKTLGNIGLCSGRISDAKAEASSPVKVEWYLVWLSDDAT